MSDDEREQRTRIPAAEKANQKNREQTLAMVFGTKKSKNLSWSDHQVRLLQFSYLHGEDMLEPPARLEEESDEDYLKRLQPYIEERRRRRKMGEAAWNPFFEKLYEAVHSHKTEFFESFAKAMKDAERKPDSHQKALFYSRVLWRSNAVTTKKKFREEILRETGIEHEDSVDWKRIFRELRAEFTDEYRELVGLESGVQVEWEEVRRELRIRDLEDAERWPKKGDN